MQACRDFCTYTEPPAVFALISHTYATCWVFGIRRLLCIWAGFNQLHLRYAFINMERNALDDSRFSPPNVSNVVQVDGIENSPASPAAGPPRQHNRQVPISRNSSTYERPERARTSHACEPCRERKTKCDGDRPSCRRCLHTSTSCHYGYGKGWKKRKYVLDPSCYWNMLNANTVQDRRRLDSDFGEARTLRNTA